MGNQVNFKPFEFDFTALGHERFSTVFWTCYFLNGHSKKNKDVGDRMVSVRIKLYA